MEKLRASYPTASASNRPTTLNSFSKDSYNEGMRRPVVIENYFIH